MTVTMRERDREKAKIVGLEICEACGWYADKYIHAIQCDPAQGRLGDALAAELPEGNPTKLGFGHGRVTFVLDEDMYVTFQINHYNTVTLHDAHDLKDHSLTGAKMIVQCFRAWATPGFKP